MPTPQLRCSPGHTWGRDPVESCSFCWNRSLSTWFCRSSSKTRFFSLMHSSRRSWSGRGGSARTPRAPRHPPSPPTLSRPPATHLLVEKCLHHVVGNLGSRGEVWGGAHGHARPRALAHACAHVYHVCTTCVPRVWLCSPVPRPGSVRMSPAGSHWPGPGLSSLPRTEQGQLRGHRGHPPGTEQTLCLLVVLRATHGRTGLPQEQWHTRAMESWKVRPIAMESRLRAPRHWPLLALGTGCMVAMAMDSRWPWPWIQSGHGCLVAPVMAAQWSRVLVVPFPHTSSSRRRCSSSWLVPVSPSTAGLPAPGASATLSDIAAAGDTRHDGVPAGPWLVAPGLRHPQALRSPALPYLALDVPSPVPVRCHLPGRTGLRRGKEPRKTPRAES